MYFIIQRATCDILPDLFVHLFTFICKYKCFTRFYKYIYIYIYCHESGSWASIYIVTNPVHGLPLTHHQRSLAHHMDSCTTLTVALHLRLQFPSPIALMIHALNTQLIALNTLLIALNTQLIALITQPT